MSPINRHRRLRQTETIRNWVRETSLAPQNLIMPFFVVPGAQQKKAIGSMPGQYQMSVDVLLKELRLFPSLGLTSLLLFGLPSKKDALGRQAYHPKGIIQQAIRSIKKHFPKLIVMADLCFCEYTSHGHCGVISRNKSGHADVDNDQTLKLIEKTALAQAKAGVDFIAPSGMMDGAVETIRRVLDKNGFSQVGILAYSAKYASAFYGPFREAAQSTPQFGHRQTYQMDPANAKEGIKEVLTDIHEGADMVMVKPALTYLDVMARIKPLIHIPLVAYNVSGEYAMVKAAVEKGWMDNTQERLSLEILTAIKRAGADLIISYHAMDVARQLRRA